MLIGDADAFAAAARRLIDEQGLRNRLSAAARSRSVEMFDHLKMAARSLDVYRSALGMERDGATQGTRAAGFLGSPRRCRTLKPPRTAWRIPFL